MKWFQDGFSLLLWPLCPVHSFKNLLNNEFSKISDVTGWDHEIVLSVGNLFSSCPANHPLKSTLNVCFNFLFLHDEELTIVLSIYEHNLWKVLEVLFGWKLLVVGN